MNPLISTPLLEYQKEQTAPLFSSLFRGFIAAFSTGLIGFDSAFSVLGRPQFGLTEDETFLFSNLYLLAAPIGSLLCALIIDKFGRRAALIWGVLPGLVGWSCFYFSSNFAIIIAGRIINGILKGWLTIAGQVYGCECLFFHYPYIRESFKIWTGIFISLCMVILEPFASVLSYSNIAAIVFVLTLLELILIYWFLPESPMWLQYQKRYTEMDKSKKALCVPQSALDDQNIMNVRSDPYGRYESCMKKLKRKDVAEPLTITTILFALTALLGGHQVLTYKSANQIYVNGNSCSVESNGFFLRRMLLATNILGAILIPLVGFKKIVYTGVTLLSVSLLLYAWTVATNDLSWQSVVVVIMVFSLDFGAFNLLFIILAYVFPVDAKGFANFGVAIVSLLTTFALYIHPYLYTMFHWWIYVVYALVDILIIFWIYFFLPEVVGKTQSEIIQYFLKPSTIKSVKF